MFKRILRRLGQEEAMVENPVILTKLRFRREPQYEVEPYARRKEEILLMEIGVWRNPWPKRKKAHRETKRIVKVRVSAIPANYRAILDDRKMKIAAGGAEREGDKRHIAKASPPPNRRQVR